MDDIKNIAYPWPSFLLDIWHGWRDGITGIPDVAKRVSTPHRDALILSLREASDQERLVHLDNTRFLREEHARHRAERIAAEREVASALEDLAALPQPTEADLTARSPAEARHHEEQIRKRRRNDHGRQRTELVEELTRRRRRADAAEGAEQAAETAVELDRQVCAIRVERVHSYTHRRIATYRRTLVRWHRDGARIAAAMDSLAPEMPEWARRTPPTPPRAEPTVPPPRPLSAEAQEFTFDVGQTLSIGSAQGLVDIPLGGRDIGDRHATVSRTAEAVELTDLGTGVGTFLYGKRVLRTHLHPGDAFDIGDYRFTLGPESSILVKEPLGQRRLVVHNLSVETLREGKAVKLLTRMSFVQRERSVLAIIGPSGAGKSTLFRAVVGEIGPPSGDLYFQDMSIPAHLEQLRPKLGFVPQKEDHLPSLLTVRSLLLHTERWRRRSSPAAARAAVAKVCAKLDLTKHLDQVLATLSGGQLKRVSIAMELLGDPNLLMLDEPTSGLDQGLDRDVMHVLRGVANAGCTVVAVTHATEHLGYADQVLVVASGGRVVYSGHPGGLPQALDGADNYGDLMETLRTEPQPLIDAYLESEEVSQAQEAANNIADGPTSTPDRRRGTWRIFLHQLPALLWRQFALTFPVEAVRRAKRADRARAVLACGVPLLLAAVSATLAVLVSEDRGLLGPQASGPGNAAVVLSVLTTLSVLIGQALTYSNLVEEFDYIQREHRTGLHIAALVLAKWFVFAVSAVGQAAVVAVVFTLWRHAPGHAVTSMPRQIELFAGLAATVVAAMSLGLLVSAVSRDLKQAVMLTSFGVLIQVVLNGITKPLGDGGALGVVAMVFPARWGLGALGASVDLSGIDPTAPTDALWSPAIGQWGLNLAVLAVLSVVYVSAAALLVKRRLRPKAQSGERATPAPPTGQVESG